MARALRLDCHRPAQPGIFQQHCTESTHVRTSKADNASYCEDTQGSCVATSAINNLKITHTQSRQIRRPERLCGINLATEVDSTQTMPRAGLLSRGDHTPMGTRRCDSAALLCASCRLHKLGFAALY